MSSEQNIDPEKTKLRTKLDDLAVLLNKFGAEFLSLENEKNIILLESGMVNKLHGLAGQLQSIESLEGKEGDVFVSFLKNLVDVVKEIGVLPIWKRDVHPLETFLRLLSIIRNLEEQTRDLLPLVLAIDEKRKEGKYETFGGLMQKLMDAFEEKRHMIIGNTEDTDVKVPH